MARGGPPDLANGGCCSTKLVETGGVANQGPLDPNCALSVVPEPMTMTLLATGLVGIGVAGLARRRRSI